MELFRLKRPLSRCRGLSHLAVMSAMLLVAPAWLGAESNEILQQEVKKSSEVLACPSQARRSDAQPACFTYFRAWCCLSEACLARRNPAPDPCGHRLSNELLAPLKC